MMMSRTNSNKISMRFSNDLREMMILIKYINLFFQIIVKSLNQNFI